jgi:adenosylcobinamide-GDP ribazoletransferase
MPMIGRWSMVELSLFSKYARSTEGIGLPFTAYLRKREFLFASATAILASFALLGIKGIIIMIVIGLFAWGSAKFLKGKIGGITGDTFGAVNEISEVLALILVLVLLKNF